MGADVTLVSSAEETAFDVYRTLVAHGIERTDPAPPIHEFEATGDDSEDFKRLASRFLGPEIIRVDPHLAASTPPARRRGLRVGGPKLDTGTIHLPRSTT
jgi:glutamate racemase